MAGGSVEALPANRFGLVTCGGFLRIDGDELDFGIGVTSILSFNPQALDELRVQLTSHKKKFQDGEKQMRLLDLEVRAQSQQPKPWVPMRLPSEVQVAMETRFSHIEEMLRRRQKQHA